VKNIPDFTAWGDHIVFTLAHVKVKGLYCEFGVYKGGSLDFFCQVARPKIHFHGFDSFRGLDEDWLDFKAGHLDLGSRPESFPFPAERVTIHEGMFAESIPIFLAKYPERAAFLHFDCDLYSSTKTVLDLLHERIVPGTVLVFDEYETGADDERKAFLETGFRFHYLSRHRPGGSVSLVIE
jgi:hypothetical protein